MSEAGGVEDSRWAAGWRAVTPGGGLDMGLAARVVPVWAGRDWQACWELVACWSCLASRCSTFQATCSGT